MLRDKVRYDDRLTVKVNLFEAYDAHIGFCERNLPDPFVIEEHTRISVRGIVCRELISNMLIHREFTSPYPAKLEIDREGLHTQNASRTFFEGNITLNDLVRCRRIPRLPMSSLR